MVAVVDDNLKKDETYCSKHNTYPTGHLHLAFQLPGFSGPGYYWCAFERANLEPAIFYAKTYGLVV